MSERTSPQTPYGALSKRDFFDRLLDEPRVSPAIDQHAGAAYEVRGCGAHEGNDIAELLSASEESQRYGPRHLTTTFYLLPFGRSHLCPILRPR